MWTWFITEAFNILRNEVKDHPAKKDCCLVFDAMAIRKQILWDQKNDEYVCFVNYGQADIECPDNVLASEALVFTLVGLRSHWKCPIAYFLTDKTSSTIQAQLIRKTLILSKEIGLHVWCITSDGTSPNTGSMSHAKACTEFYSKSRFHICRESGCTLEVLWEFKWCAAKPWHEAG